jgi:hypothetical protein
MVVSYTATDQLMPLSRSPELPSLLKDKEVFLSTKKIMVCNIEYIWINPVPLFVSQR